MKRMPAKASNLASFFGDEMRRHRRRVGLSENGLSEIVPWSFGTVHAVEHGVRRPPEGLGRYLDRTYGLPEVMERLEDLVGRESNLSWFGKYKEIEEQAVAIHTYEPTAITGLAQDPEYARAISLAMYPDQPAEQVAVGIDDRMERQRRILDKPDAADVWIVQDEASLCRPVGGPEVMRNQLAALLEFADRPRVMVQVLPFAAGEHASMAGGLTVLEMPDGERIAYAEARDMARFITERDEVRHCEQAIERLRAAALSPANSLDLIATVMEDWYS